MTTRLREVAPGVWVATARLHSSNSTSLLDGSGGAVVVDPSWEPDELAAIPADLAALGVECVAGFATHEHYDHVMWHPELGDVPRWTSPRTFAHYLVERDKLLEPLAEYLTPDLISIAGRLDPLPDGHLPWFGPRARCITHDAHAPGHVALMVEESGVLVSGDMLSDLELPMPADADLTLDTYLSGMDALREAASSASLVIPGHGTPSFDPMSRWDADMRYLDDIISGRESADPRIDDPENDGLHQANVERARRMRGTH